MTVRRTSLLILALLGLPALMYLLLQAQCPQRVVFPGHNCPVYHVIASPDGMTLASIGWEDKAIKVWDVASRKERATSQGTDATFRSDGKILAWVDADNTIRLWNVEKGEEQVFLRANRGRVSCVALSPDARMVASAGDDNKINLWDFQAAKVRLTLPGHTKSIHSLVFSPDGRVLASGSNDQTVKLWEVGTGRERFTIREDAWIMFAVPYSPPCVAFSPDGRTLASWGNMTIKLCDVATGQERMTLSDPDWCSEYLVEAVAFSADGSQLVSLFGDTINVWSTASGRKLATIEMRNGSHPIRAKLGRVGGRIVDAFLNLFEEPCDTLRSVLVRPDGKVFALGNGACVANQGEVKMWEITSLPCKER